MQWTQTKTHQAVPCIALHNKSVDSDIRPELQLWYNLGSWGILQSVYMLESSVENLDIHVEIKETKESVARCFVEC
jgi:hypothetical protein